MKKLLVTILGVSALVGIGNAQVPDAGQGDRKESKAAKLISKEEAGKGALGWWKACRAGDAKTALAATGDVVVVGERDGRSPDWSLSLVKGRKDIENLLKRMVKDRKEELKIESVGVVTKRKLPDGGALPKQMPDCNFVITIASSVIDDVLEVFMNAEGKVVGFFEVER